MWSCSRVQWVLLVFMIFLGSVAVALKYDADKTYVHVVPHTHDDVGWLKTVDEYFYGANKSIQQAAVQYVLDTVVQELQLDKSRTFIYVEIAFFSRWWNQQNDATKEVVKDLVKNGQLEFINAGWCMNDEASTDYNAIIDQMGLGLKFVEDNFGADARPTVAWQIDPFGHSSEQAAIFSQMGFNGLFFARNDYDDRSQRLKDKTMEMVWRPSKSLGSNSDLFTGILYYGYGPPPGFCFDMRCSDDPIQDDPRLMDYNVDKKVEDFFNAINDQLKHYQTNHIMFTMGSDFQYESAREWYKNLDKIMKYTMEAHPDIEVMYSTPSRYLEALNEADLTWTVKSDDFFPYADNPWAYWTGYFTSRPALKQYTRKMNTLLQSCRRSEVWAKSMKFEPSTTSEGLAEAMGVDQHHDAVSGTEKQHVANDYAKRLHRGQVNCTNLMAEVSAEFMASKSSGAKPGLAYCEYLNVSACLSSEGAAGGFDVFVYNPLAKSVMVPIKFPVSQDNFLVMSDSGITITSQTELVTMATKIARGKLGNAPYVLTFIDTLPALGGRTYFVRPSKNMKHKIFQKELKLGGDDFKIGEDGYPIVITFDGVTGRIKNINNTVSKKVVDIEQTFMWYNSSDGHNVNSSQASGAYIFRPNGTYPFNVSEDGKVQSLVMAQGPLYTDVYQEFSPWVYQQVRIFKDLSIVQLDYTVGPIPIQDGLGKEIISQFSSDLDTQGVWYTDANGREMQERKRNYRPTWTYNNTEPVAGNYYPVNSRIYIKDESRDVQLSVLNDRSQGGSSLNDGQIELMVHRRTLHDDGRGVGEPLNETGVDGAGLIIRGSHILLLDNINQSTFLHRVIGEAMMLRPELLFIKDSGDPSAFTQKYFTNFTKFMKKDLPFNVHLLTLQVWDDKSFLMRLEHMFEDGETDRYGVPVTVSLEDYFAFSISNVTELILSANADFPVERLKWKTTTGPMKVPGNIAPVKGPKYDVKLNPMEIRTFKVDIDF